MHTYAISFDSDEYKIQEKGFSLASETNKIHWLHFTDPSPQEVQDLIHEMNLHPMLARAMSTYSEVPQIEHVGEYLVITVRLGFFENGEFCSFPIMIVSGENVVISVAKKSTNCFEPVFHRLQEADSFIRKQTDTYLSYALVIAALEHNNTILNAFEESVEKLENDVLESFVLVSIDEIYELRAQFLTFRQFNRPTYEMLQTLLHEPGNHREKASWIYLQTVLEKSRELASKAENQRETIKHLIELYHMQVNLDLSKVMKFLAIISTIFIPLNLIAAIYGMNFKYMPELEVKYLYFGVLFVMVMIATSMLLYFKRKRWL